MKKVAMHRSMLAGAAALAVLGMAARASADDAPAAQVAQGRAAYLADGCFQCHGRQGQGGRGPALAGTELPYESFAMLVREPIANMPPYGPKVMSDARLAEVYAFVKALEGPPPADKLPALLRR